MKFSQFLSILRARWIAVAVVLCLTVGVTVAVSLLLPKTYTATATVMIDVRSPDPLTGSMMNGMAAAGYMATQVDILSSIRVSQRVAQNLRLVGNPQLQSDWREKTQGRGVFEVWVAEMLLKNLAVKPARESSVIEVSYRSPDPKFAAAMANAFVQAYIETNIGLRASPAKLYSNFFEERSKKLRQDLEAAQAKLTAFQEKNGITGQDERFDMETQRLNELSSQLVALQALSVDAQSRSRQARNSAERSQEVIGNGLVSGLRADMSRQEARLRELKARLGDAHPQVVELRANIDELRARVDAESQRVTGGVESNSEIMQRRENEVRIALEAQRAKVLRLKEVRQEMMVHMREVDTLQRNYDLLIQRVSQTDMESQNTQTNIALLTPATEPVEPSGPRIFLNTLLSLFLGSALAVGFAVVRELMDRRVRTLEDISGQLGLPVLGVLPRPKGRLPKRASAQLGVSGGALAQVTPAA
jgi:chain length determinant protein EpsF